MNVSSFAPGWSQGERSKSGVGSAGGGAVEVDVVGSGGVVVGGEGCKLTRRPWMERERERWKVEKKAA